MKDAGRGKKIRKHTHQKKQIAKEHVYGSISSKMEAESAVRGVRNSKDAAESAFRGSIRCQNRQNTGKCRSWGRSGEPLGPKSCCIDGLIGTTSRSEGDLGGILAVQIVRS